MRTGNTKKKETKTNALSEDGAKENQYLAGLKKYKNQGIPIYIDGQEVSEADWNKIFEVREECFYMADYVPDENGKIQEIRFDKVYNR